MIATDAYYIRVHTICDREGRDAIATDAYYIRVQSPVLSDTISETVLYRCVPLVFRRDSRRQHHCVPLVSGDRAATAAFKQPLPFVEASAEASDSLNTSIP